MADRDANRREMVQYDLLAARAIEFGNYLSIKEISHEALHPAWHAFQSNIESVRTMANLPQEVLYAAIDHLLTLSQATFNVLGRPVMFDGDLAPNRDAISEEYSNIKERFFDGRRKVVETFWRDLFIHNSNTLVNSPLNKAGFFALLESIIIGAWTAFDALTTDLFVAALNARPEVLRQFDKRNIPLGNLLDAGDDMNWNGRMGELARKFLNLDLYARKTEEYERAFHSELISGAIESQKAATACLVRNQLIHDSGIATKSFVSQAKKAGVSPWMNVEEGRRLPLDGNNVSGLAEDLIECANELVKAIDDWLGLPARRAAKLPVPTP